MRGPPARVCGRVRTGARSSSSSLDSNRRPGVVQIDARRRVVRNRAPLVAPRAVQCDTRPVRVRSESGLRRRSGDSTAGFERAIRSRGDRFNSTPQRGIRQFVCGRVCGLAPLIRGNSRSVEQVVNNTAMPVYRHTSSKPVAGHGGPATCARLVLLLAHLRRLREAVRAVAASGDRDAMAKCSSTVGLPRLDVEASDRRPECREINQLRIRDSWHGSERFTKLLRERHEPPRIEAGLARHLRCREGGNRRPSCPTPAAATFTEPRLAGDLRRPSPSR